MGRLFLFAIALCAVGVAVADRFPRERIVAAAPVAVREAAPQPVAHRPGEPMLVPGQATELRRDATGHFYAEVLVNGQPVPMLVDTGATAVALSVGDAGRLGIAVDPATFAVVGTGASGPVRGVAVTLDSVALGGRQVAAVRAVVLEGLDRSLLGQSFLGQLDQVQIAGDVMTLR